MKPKPIFEQTGPKKWTCNLTRLLLPVERYSRRQRELFQQLKRGQRIENRIFSYYLRKTLGDKIAKKTTLGKGELLDYRENIPHLVSQIKSLLSAVKQGKPIQEDRPLLGLLKIARKTPGSLEALGEAVRKIEETHARVEAGYKEATEQLYQELKYAGKSIGQVEGIVKKLVRTPLLNITVEEGGNIVLPLRMSFRNRKQTAEFLRNKTVFSVTGVPREPEIRAAFDRSYLETLRESNLGAYKRAIAILKQNRFFSKSHISHPAQVDIAVVSPDYFLFDTIQSEARERFPEEQFELWSKHPEAFEKVMLHTEMHGLSREMLAKAAGAERQVLSQLKDFFNSGKRWRVGKDYLRAKTKDGMETFGANTLFQTALAGLLFCIERTRNGGGNAVYAIPGPYAISNAWGGQFKRNIRGIERIYDEIGRHLSSDEYERKISVLTGKEMLDKQKKPVLLGLSGIPLAFLNPLLLPVPLFFSLVWGTQNLKTAFVDGRNGQIKVPKKDSN